MNMIDVLTEKVLGPISDTQVANFANLKITFSDVVIIIIIFVCAYAAYLLLTFLVNIQVRRNKLRKAQSRILLQLAGYIITVFTISSVFSLVGYSLTYLFVGSTALLVGLGFGLQQLFVDLISGIILLIDKNVNYGDVMQTDIPGAQMKMKGRIIQIGLRATILESIDNERYIVPNSKLLSNGVRSLMRDKGSVRFRIHISVEFNSDMELAKKLMTEAVLSNEKVDQDPLPTIIIKEFQENGVLLEIRFWMKELFNSENILSDIRFELLKLFRENKVVIPYPKRVMLEGIEKTQKI